MKITKEMRKLSPAELGTRKKELQHELLKLKVQIATGANVASPGKVGQIKKNIAIINTIVREVQPSSQ